MGLDVYLYRYDDREKSALLEAQYEKESEEIWDNNEKKYEEYTKEEKDDNNQKCVAVAERLGLGKYGDDETYKKEIELSSEKYPDHLFKIGYFRSSYNSGGINHILRNLGEGNDLHWVFGRDDDGYVFAPNWEQAKERAKELIELLSSNEAYYVARESWNIFSGPPDVKSEKEALDIFKEELTKSSGLGSYSNGKGTFFMEKPLPVYGIVLGQEEMLSRSIPCVYLIHKAEDEEGEGYSFYVQALEIVIETCDYVLSQPDPEKYYLHWSG